MREINKFIVHCADTPNDFRFDIDDITKWHIQRGFKTVGYHFVILTNGFIQRGRPIEDIGAHTQGHNKDSIGVCLIGGRPPGEFTEAQYKSLKDVYNQCCEITNKQLQIFGHRDFDKGKTCPTFDVKKVFDAPGNT